MFKYLTHLSIKKLKTAVTLLVKIALQLLYGEHKHNFPVIMLNLCKKNGELYNYLNAINVLNEL